MDHDGISRVNIAARTKILDRDIRLTWWNFDFLLHRRVLQFSSCVTRCRRRGLRAPCEIADSITLVR